MIRDGKTKIQNKEKKLARSQPPGTIELCSHVRRLIADGGNGIQYKKRLTTRFRGGSGRREGRNNDYRRSHGPVPGQESVTWRFFVLRPESNTRSK